MGQSSFGRSNVVMKATSTEKVTAADLGDDYFEENIKISNPRGVQD